MSEELTFDDRTYVSSRRASELSSYAQDYIGHLARTGQIDARRAGGLWYIDMDSLESYKNKTADEVKERIPNDLKSNDKGIDTLVSFDGRDYISANRASYISGYNQDYIGQLARSNKIPSRQVGNRWYVDRDALLRHKKEKDALLAAVQADSVGIRRTVAIESNQSIPDSTGDLLKYIPEKADLAPQIIQKYPDREVSQTPSGGQESSVAISPSPIPIHVVRQAPQGTGKKRPLENPYAIHAWQEGPACKTPARPLIRNLIAPLVIVLSCLLCIAVYVRTDLVLRGPLYAMVRPNVVEMDMQVQTVFKTATIDFENLFVPEITFQRSE